MKGEYKYSSQAFTLIELMVVVAIIAILSSLLLAGMSVLKERERVFKTESAMSSLQVAINMYIEHDGNASLIDVNAGERMLESPATVLLSYPSEEAPILPRYGQKVYVNFSKSGYVDWSDATHVADGWVNPIEIWVSNILPQNIGGKSTNIVYTDMIAMSSSRGTKEHHSDDIVYIWTRESGKYDKVRPIGRTSTGRYTTE